LANSPVQTDGAQAEDGAAAEQDVQRDPNVAQYPAKAPSACKEQIFVAVLQSVCAPGRD